MYSCKRKYKILQLKPLNFLDSPSFPQPTFSLKNIINILCILAQHMNIQAIGFWTTEFPITVSQIKDVKTNHFQWHFKNWVHAYTYFSM